MIKFILFPILWLLTGNFFVSLVLVLIIFYVIDRRYIGFMPNLWRPFQLNRRAKLAKLELRSNPYHTSMKLELARIYLEKKKYRAAIPLLEEVLSTIDDSADAHYELGLCNLKLGELAKGEFLMQEALRLNSRVRFGEAYLRLSEAYASSDPAKAITYIEQFKTTNSSSCEAYYRLGMLYQVMKQRLDAKQAYREAVQIYRSLPKYSRKKQRRWALLATFKQLFV